MYNGIINFYKETGHTSHDAVAALRRILHQKKIGHTGTLDPAAVGVLPICLGTGTKLAGMLTDTDKEYRAVLRLGVRTDTQDLTGNVLEERPADVTPGQILKAAASFTGTYLQTPPMYSAVKVDGKRLYELARQGVSVERQPRQVTIYRLEVEEIRLPDITMTVACSKGTYIRTLCEDLGNALGTGGAMAQLTRTRAAGFSIDSSLRLAQIASLQEQGLLEEYIISPEEVFSALPAAKTRAQADQKARNGNALGDADLEDIPGIPQHKDVTHRPDGDGFPRIRVRDSEGGFIGTYVFREERQLWMPEKIFYRKP